MAHLTKAKLLVSAVLSSDIELVWEALSAFTTIQSWILPTDGLQLYSERLVRLGCSSLFSTACYLIQHLCEAALRVCLCRRLGHQSIRLDVSE